MLYLAFRHNTDTSLRTAELNFDEAIRQIPSHRNATLMKISSAAPTLVVFLRHAGCTFCREALSQLENVADDVRRTRTNLAIVHMGSPMDGTMMLQKRKLANLHHFSDPHCILYRAFDLKRGELTQLFSLDVIKRGFRAILKGHGLGKLAGDGFRMPGAFMLVDGKIIAEHRGMTAADHPDYRSLLSLPAIHPHHVSAPHDREPAKLAFGRF